MCSRAWRIGLCGAGSWGVAIAMGDRVLSSRHVILPSRLVSLRVGAHVQIFSISVKEELDTDKN